MRRCVDCVILLSVCYLGLAAAQLELSDNIDQHSQHMGPACGENEEYKECVNPCVDEDCDALGSLIPNCTSPEPCQPGCACKEGFFKLYSSVCVPKCNCSRLRDKPECQN